VIIINKPELKCIKCGEILSFSNWGNIRDINDKPIRCCKNCAESVITELKQKRFVENYKGADIYLFEGNYYPYWGCAYCFSNIENCRSRIDNNTISIVPTELLNRVAKGKSLL
jgi:hypothetical protein